MASGEDARYEWIVHPHTGQGCVCERIVVDVPALLAWTHQHRPLTWSALAAYLFDQTKARRQRDGYHLAIATLDMLEGYSASLQRFPLRLTLLRTRCGAILTRDDGMVREVLAGLPRRPPRRAPGG
jgi:hypothetical protein